MAAEPVQRAPISDLLAEPDPPALTMRQRWAGGGPRPGWRRAANGDIVRDHEHDEAGARVQHIIIRYMLVGTGRRQLAEEYHLCERQVQAYLAGTAMAAYGAPIIRALHRLGISQGRGRRYTTHGRQAEILRASRRVMTQAVEALTGARRVDLVEWQQLIADLRLLAVGGEEHHAD